MKDLTPLQRCIIAELIQNPHQLAKTLVEVPSIRKYTEDPKTIQSMLRLLRKKGYLANGHVVLMNRLTKVRKYYVFIHTKFPCDDESKRPQSIDYQRQLVESITEVAQTIRYRGVLFLGAHIIMGVQGDIVMELAVSGDGQDNVSDFVTDCIRIRKYVESTSTAFVALPSDKRGNIDVPDELTGGFDDFSNGDEDCD